MVDENDDAVDLSGYTASAKMTDEDNVTILDLSPSVTSTGYFIIDVEMTASIGAGRYDWKGYLQESTGEQHVRFQGKVKLDDY